MNNKKTLTRKAYEAVLQYLDDSGIYLPEFEVVFKPSLGGSTFYLDDPEDGACWLKLARYPTRSSADWFVMHELGHALCFFHNPCRNRIFKRYFGQPEPDNYLKMHRRYSWSSIPGGKLRLFRPKGEPSWYGSKGGGEERFCELIGFMYTRGGFDKEPPEDLRELWDVCWKHGLSKMTQDSYELSTS